MANTTAMEATTAKADKSAMNTMAATPAMTAKNATVVMATGTRGTRLWIPTYIFASFPLKEIYIAFCGRA